MQLLLLCQQNLENNLTCHPVDWLRQFAVEPFDLSFTHLVLEQPLGPRPPRRGEWDLGARLHRPDWHGAYGWVSQRASLRNNRWIEVQIVGYGKLTVSLSHQEAFSDCILMCENVKEGTNWRNVAHTIDVLVESHCCISLTSQLPKIPDEKLISNK